MVHAAGRRYQVVSRLDTESNSTAYVCRDEHGALVVVKRAPAAPDALGSSADELAAQARQVEAVRPFAPAGLYPPILARDRRTLVIPFYPDGSAGALARSDPARAVDVLGAALDALFAVAGAADSRPAGASESMAAELSSRARRLLGRLEAEPGLTLLDAASGRPVSSLVPALVRGRREPLPGRMALAAHGDLVPTNVVVAPAGAEPAVRFIDVRGRVPWRGGLPWWDPVLDIAAVVAWLRGARALGEPVPAATIEAALLERLPASAAFERWASLDRAWRSRLDLAVAAKLLGKVSIELVYGGRERTARAQLMWELFRAALPR
jgi:hypothetical protein